MKLRKALTITGLFFIILIVLGELLLPTVVESALESRLSQKFSTPHVDVELSASPRLMLLFGRTDSLSVTVKDGQVGQLRVHEMALSGRKAVLDMSSFTAGRLALEQAEALDLTAMFDENGLREALARKINKADNVEAGGIIIPDTAKEKPLQGEVLAVGNGTKDEEMVLKAGDTVLYGKYAGTEVELDGEKYLIMRQSDVLAVLA